MVFITLTAAAILIYYSCELFVNGIEWVGRKFNISQNAVGTVLAAFGTALPESVVTFVAVVFGTTAAQKDIGVGAALGGPLVLSTLAYAIVGLGIIIFRKQRAMGNRIDLDDHKLGRDQFWFLWIFLLKAVLGFVVFSGKGWLSLFFVLAYAIYCCTEFTAVGEEKEVFLQPLKFRPKKSDPETGWVLLQTVVALSLIFTGSHIFVSRLELVSQLLGVPPHIIALLLSPVATELPEILNAVIWVRQGKERLALGNISGAMMIQATIPTALGLAFTPWIFDAYLTIAAITTIISILFLWHCLRKKQFSAGHLLAAALFYAGFVAAVLFVGKI